ncbi:MAG: iron-sulfur cluster assembly protein, partial [archaeon GB-1867-035]|nr:iron-sulfur cluster assembly protein [Candidatus Culexmicrobium profundum]
MKSEGNELKDEILKKLKDVIDPEVGLSVVDMGLIKEVTVKGNKATIKMTLTVPSF